ncbi:MAG TPA: ribonuclease III domain-containing protein [Coleofasciculaceae cyanobacterium]
MELESAIATDSPSVEAGWLAAAALRSPLPLSPSIPIAEIQRLSPAALAYLGDSVYELYIRCYYLLPQSRTRTYHDRVVAQVRAETQARHIEALLPHLTDAERDMVRRGRNATDKRPKRLEGATYQAATGFETLVGYLYLTQPARLTELLARLDFSPSISSHATVDRTSPP